MQKVLCIIDCEQTVLPIRTFVREVCQLCTFWYYSGEREAVPEELRNLSAFSAEHLPLTKYFNQYFILRKLMGIQGESEQSALSWALIGEGWSQKLLCSNA